MAFNPGITFDTQSLGQGIGAGLQNLTQTLERNRQERLRKEEERKTREAVQAGGRDVFGAGFDLKDAPAEAFDSILKLAAAKRDAPLREAQLATQQLALENERLKQRISAVELEALGANAAALGEAGQRLGGRPATGQPVGGLPATGRPADAGQPAPTGARDALTAFLQRGGTDPRIIDRLGQLAQAEERSAQRGGPQLLTLGKDSAGRPVEGVVDAQGNFSRIKDDTGDDPSTQLARLIRERDAFAAAGRADVVAEYDRVISNFGTATDPLRQIVAGALRPPEPAPAPAAPAQASPASEDQRQARLAAIARRRAELQAKLGR